MNIRVQKLLLVIILIGLAAVSPYLFVAAQSGKAPFSLLVKDIFIPSILMIAMMIFLLKILKYHDITRLAIHGIAAGLIATIALEVVRETGFRLGAMPGELPRLMGVLMLNQFSSGPDLWSDLAGWSYHFWNGAAFGLILSLLIGPAKTVTGILYGLLIGIVFMTGPVVKSLGIGLFGAEFRDGYQFATTVALAHIAFGISLSFLLIKWNKTIPGIMSGLMKKKIPAIHLPGSK
jgi:hypothetical protein